MIRPELLSHGNSPVPDSKSSYCIQMHHSRPEWNDGTSNIDNHMISILKSEGESRTLASLGMLHTLKLSHQETIVDLR